jgi:hypothetical protein
MKITAKSVAEQRRAIAWHAAAALFFFLLGIIFSPPLGLPGVSFLTIALYLYPAYRRDFREQQSQ